MTSGSSARSNPTLARAVKCLSPKYTASAPASIAARNCGQYPAGLITSGLRGECIWRATLSIVTGMSIRGVLEQLVADIRYGLRNHAKTRSFAAIAVGSLALGIGGSTAMYSVIYAVILDPFPYKDPDHLM